MPNYVHDFHIAWVGSDGILVDHPGNEGAEYLTPSNLPETEEWGVFTRSNTRPVVAAWSYADLPGMFYVAAKHGSRKGWDAVGVRSVDSETLVRRAAFGPPPSELFDRHRETVRTALRIDRGVPTSMCDLFVFHLAAMSELVALLRRERPREYEEAIFVNYLEDWRAVVHAPGRAKVEAMVGSEHWARVAEISGFATPTALLGALFPGPHENFAYLNERLAPTRSALHARHLEEQLASPEGRAALIAELGRLPSEYADGETWRRTLAAAIDALLQRPPAEVFARFAFLCDTEALTARPGVLRAELALGVLADRLEQDASLEVDRWFAGAVMDWGQHPQLVEAASRVLCHALRRAHR